MSESGGIQAAEEPGMANLVVGTAVPGGWRDDGPLDQAAANRLRTDAEI